MSSCKIFCFANACFFSHVSFFSCRKYCDKNMTCTNWRTRVHFNKTIRRYYWAGWINSLGGTLLALCRVDVRKRPLSEASQVTLCAWWPLCSRSSWSTPRFCPLWCARWWRLRTRHRWSHQRLRPPDTEAAGGAVSRSEDVLLQVSSRLLERKAEGERGYFCLKLTLTFFQRRKPASVNNDLAASATIEPRLPAETLRRGVKPQEA